MLAKARQQLANCPASALYSARDAESRLSMQLHLVIKRMASKRLAFIIAIEISSYLMAREICIKAK